MLSRSEFLKQLIASVTMGKLPVSITKNFRKIYLLQCFIAGFRYYEGMKMLDSMNEGDLIELVREPGNIHDSCAIALYLQRRKIGFIPAANNEMLSHLLDANALSLFAVITHLEKNTQPWENVAIAVYFIQEADKDLPSHANYLTRIEAPHYRTLNKKQHLSTPYSTTNYHNLFEDTDRVINLDTIPPNQKDAKIYFEKYYSKYPVSINKPGRFVHVKNDGIYTYMYEIDDNVLVVKDSKGKEFLEFFLI